MKFKRKRILENLLYGFHIKIKSSTSMNEVKKYEKMEEMKLQEKYRLITQRVLNPNANPYTGSMIIFIILPLVQNTKRGALLFRKLRVNNKLQPYER